MTTPAISVDSITRADHPMRVTYTTSSGQTVTYRNSQVYQLVNVRNRPQSANSPVREDGSRAPKAWQHTWFLWQGFPRRITVRTGKRYARNYLLDYYEGVSIGILGPANTSAEIRKQIYAQARFTWCGGSPLAEFPPSVMAAATTKVRLKALEGAATLGTSLVELHKTAGFVASIATRTEKTIRYLASASPRDLIRNWKQLPKDRRNDAKRKRVNEVLRRGRVDRRLHRESKAAYKRRLAAERWVIDKWLETQFAVKPLVMDLVSAVEALDYWKNQRGLPLRCTFKAGASREWAGNYQRIGNPSGGSFAQGSVIFTTPMLMKARAHYSLVYDIPVSTDRDLQQLGLTSPAADAWEVVQFSWMIDYVLGVGDWLRAMTRMDHLNFVEGTLSLLGEVKSDGGSVFVNPNPADLNTYGCTGTGHCLLNGGRFVRQVLTATPAPAGFPALKKKLGLNQMANAISALVKTAGSSGNLRI